MARPTFATVADYLTAQPAPVRALLRHVREAIRTAVPAAEERIGYGIPAYTLEGVPVIYFAGFAAHSSLYPATDGVAEAFARELAPYQRSKGTIRFPLDRPVPVRLVARIARFRAGVARERAEARRTRKRARR